jgi:hypothetical protein
VTALQIEVDVGRIGLERELGKKVPLRHGGLGRSVLEDERVSGGRAHGSAPDGVIVMRIIVHYIDIATHSWR